jgi:hypothetical protein
MVRGSRRLHIEELYASLNIVRVVKSRRKRWAGHVARIEKDGKCNVLVRKLEGKRPRVERKIGNESCGNVVGRCRLDTSDSS